MKLPQLFVVAFSLLLIAACEQGSPPVSDPGPRILAHWQALKTRDFATTYKSEKRSVREPKLDPIVYLQTMQKFNNIDHFVIREIRLDGKRAFAVIDTTQPLKLGEFKVELARSYRDKWEWFQGEWYHVAAKTLPPEKDEGAGDTAGGESETSTGTPPNEGEPGMPSSPEETDGATSSGSRPLPPAE